MLISLNKRMIVDGAGHEIGDVVELDDLIAGEWIGRGWAEPAVVTPPVLPEQPPFAIGPVTATLAPAETATSGPQRRRTRGGGSL